MKMLVPCMLVVLIGCQRQMPDAPVRSLVNLAHLEHLMEKISMNGESVSIVHIYSEYPQYSWVDAEGQETEGIACVDDAARAAVLFLRHYQITNQPRSLEHARSLLRFVINMQAEDGQFYNFIYRDHSINSSGKTSFKSFGWWAARGLWSMCLGYRILAPSGDTLAPRLRTGIERCLPHIDSLLVKYGQFDTIRGYRTPRWLIYGSGADVTSELLLGLSEFYATSHDERVADMIQKLAAGLMAMQDGSAATYPYDLHRSWETSWHMWGNGQTQVLAAAGKLLHDTTMIRSAEREACGLYTRLLVDKCSIGSDIVDSVRKIQRVHIAYDLRPMAVGLIRLYESTGKDEYLKMAGLAGSWLMGNNFAHRQMYDSATGRCYDGIRDSDTVNLNSGAESTIEGLYALAEIEQYPMAKQYLSFALQKSGSTPKSVYGVFRSLAGKEITLQLDLKNSQVIILQGDRSNEL